MAGKRKDKKKQKKERRNRGGPESEPQTPFPQTSSRHIGTSQNKKRLSDLKPDIRSYLNQDISDSKSPHMAERKKMPPAKKKRLKKGLKERGSHPIERNNVGKKLDNYMLEQRTGQTKMQRIKMFYREADLSDKEEGPDFGIKRHLGSLDFDKSIEIQSKSNRKIKYNRDPGFQVNSMNHIPMGLEKDSKLKRSLKQSGNYNFNQNNMKQSYNISVNKYFKMNQRKRGNNSYSQVRGTANTSRGLYEPITSHNRLFQNTSGSINYFDPPSKKDPFKAMSRKISKNHSLSGIEGNILNYGAAKMGPSRIKKKIKVKSRATYNPKTKGSNRSIQAIVHKSIRVKKKASKKDKYSKPKTRAVRTRGIERQKDKLKFQKMSTIPQIYNDKKFRNLKNYHEQMKRREQEAEVELYSYNRPSKEMPGQKMFLMDMNNGKQNMYPQMGQSPEINYMARRYDKDIKIQEFDSMDFDDQGDRGNNPGDRGNNPRNRPIHYSQSSFGYQKDFNGYDYEIQQFYKRFDEIVRGGKKPVIEELHNCKEVWEYERAVFEIARRKYEMVSQQKAGHRFEIMTMIKDLRTLSMKIFQYSNILFSDMNNHMGQDVNIFS